MKRRILWASVIFLAIVLAVGCRNNSEKKLSTSFSEDSYSIGETADIVSNTSVSPTKEEATKRFRIELLDSGMGSEWNNAIVKNDDLSYWGKYYYLKGMESPKEIEYEADTYTARYAYSLFTNYSSRLIDYYNCENGDQFSLDHDSGDVIRCYKYSYYKEELKTKPGSKPPETSDTIRLLADAILQQSAELSEFSLERFDKQSNGEDYDDIYTIRYYRSIAGLKTRDLLLLSLSSQGLVIAKSLSINDFIDVTEEDIDAFTTLNIQEQLDMLTEQAAANEWGHRLKSLSIDDAFLALTPKHHELVMIVYTTGAVEYVNPLNNQVEEVLVFLTFVIRDPDFVPTGTFFEEPEEELPSESQTSEESKISPMDGIPAEQIIQEEEAVRIIIQELERVEVSAADIKVVSEPGPGLNRNSGNWMIPLEYYNKAVKETQRACGYVNALTGEIADFGYGGGAEMPFPEE